MGLCIINGTNYNVGYDDGLYVAWVAYFVGKTGEGE